MPFIRVPDVGVRGMIELSTWTGEQFSALVNAIEASPVEVPMQPVLIQAAKKLSNASTDGAVAFASMMQAVTSTRKSFPGSDREYLEELLESASLPERGENRPSQAQIKILRDRLSQLLDLSKLAISSKATELLFEREKIATDFLMITDVRPVFNASGKISLNSMLVLHSLKIDYISDGDSKEFFLAIDETDLNKLIDLAQRAIDKGKSLTERFNACGLDVIQIRGGA